MSTNHPVWLQGRSMACRSRKRLRVRVAPLFAPNISCNASRYRTSARPPERAFAHRKYNVSLCRENSQLEELIAQVADETCLPADPFPTSTALIFKAVLAAHRTMPVGR
jgi:hypothetical protein